MSRSMMSQALLNVLVGLLCIVFQPGPSATMILIFDQAWLSRSLEAVSCLRIIWDCLLVLSAPDGRWSWSTRRKWNNWNEVLLLWLDSDLTALSLMYNWLLFDNMGLRSLPASIAVAGRHPLYSWNFVLALESRRYWGQDDLPCWRLYDTAARVFFFTCLSDITATPIMQAFFV